MKPSDATREFLIRYYRWSISEFEHEIASSFPVLGRFHAGLGWKIHRFMQQLERSEQKTLAHGILTRWHQGATEALGDTLGDDEDELLEKFDSFCRLPTDAERAIGASKQAGERVRFPSKRMLRKMMVAKFVRSYGSQCVRMELGEEWDPLFDMRCQGWIVRTQLWFGRQQPVLDPRHSIVSEATIFHPRNPTVTGPAVVLTPAVDWLVNTWESLTAAEAESACDGALEICGRLYAALPELLENLEFTKVEWR